MQKADGAALRIVGAERVRANEFREPRRLMNRGRPGRPHFMEHHGNIALRQLPSRLAAGETAANDMNWPQSIHRFHRVIRHYTTM
jgi:hypothetical protein